MHEGNSEAATRDEELARAVGLRERGELERARELLVALAARHPDDAQVAYQAAWAHDRLGLETEAAPYYERALAGEGLSGADRLGAWTGLGSTLRVLGRYAEALELLDRALREFPGDPGLRTFRAMALYNLGRPEEAVPELLRLVAESGHVGGYGRAVTYYADNLHETV